VYEQIYQPVAGSLVLSTVVAAIPILVLFVLLAGLRVAAQWASLITLAVALVIAVLVYQMPIGLALNSTLLGICFGLFPIVWIVINATFLKYKQPSRQKPRLPQPCRASPQPLSVEAPCIFGVAPAA
jgi:lactate permease